MEFSAKIRLEDGNTCEFCLDQNGGLVISLLDAEGIPLQYSSHAYLDLDEVIKVLTILVDIKDR